MTITVLIRKANPPTGGETVILKTRGYGHPDIASLFGLDTDLTGSNFNHVDYYDPAGRWSAVSKWQSLSHEDYLYLMALQPVPSGPVESWLIGDTTGDERTPQRPLWWALKNGERVLRCGTSVFGENVVKVEARNGRPVEYIFNDSYPGESRIQAIPFYRVIGMTPADKGSVTHQSHPWLIHRCNQANKGNVIDWYPKGETIYYPVLSYAYWPPNTKATGAYIARVQFYGS